MVYYNCVNEGGINNEADLIRRQNETEQHFGDEHTVARNSYIYPKRP